MVKLLQNQALNTKLTRQHNLGGCCTTKLKFHKFGKVAGLST